MKARIIFLLCILLMLVIYSTEVVFMLNYIKRGDSWHLFTWTILFLVIQFFVLIINVIAMIRQKKINTEASIIIVLAFLFFGLLSNLNFIGRGIGFIGLIIILLYMMINKIRNSKA